MTIDITGLADMYKVEADLRTTAGRVGERGSIVVRKTAHDIEATGKQFVPVDTSATKNSIGVDITGDGRFASTGATIGPTTSYSVFLEYGTSKMAPHAFMGPALDRHTPAFAAAVEAISDPLVT